MPLYNKEKVSNGNTQNTALVSPAERCILKELNDAHVVLVKPKVCEVAG